MVRASFDDLVLIDREILAQAGQRDRGRSQLQIAQAALKKRLVGQYRKRRRAAGEVVASKLSCFKVGTNQPPGG